jgi:peroxiredoxin 2/4
VAFENRRSEFEKLNCQLRVLSIGQVSSHMQWTEWIKENLDEILRALEALQVSDANKVSMPANWPNSDPIKDEVIIPPLSDEKTAKTRVTGGDIVCYDWWFCHKKL